MKADLHNHSYYSDGVLSPSEVVRLGHEAGCDLFSLTDHDTTDGLDEAVKAAAELPMNLVTGVEISAFWRNMTIHIVGLDVDVDSEILQKGLRYNQLLRSERAEKIALGLRRAGIADAMEKTQALSKTPMLTRTHFAQMLIQEGYCKDMKSVFRRFLVGKKPGGTRVEWREYDEVIGWIHAAGGRAVLAHPFRYRMTNTKIKKMLVDFKEAGGDAMEVITATSSPDEISWSEQWASEFNLLSSCGSDYHGWPNQRIRMGRLADLPESSNEIWKYFKTTQLKTS
jgi:hypothetical protein